MFIILEEKYKLIYLNFVVVDQINLYYLYYILSLKEIFNEDL